MRVLPVAAGVRYGFEALQAPGCTEVRSCVGAELFGGETDHEGCPFPCVLCLFVCGDDVFSGEVEEFACDVYEHAEAAVVAEQRLCFRYVAELCSVEGRPSYSSNARAASGPTSRVPSSPGSRVLRFCSFGR